MSALPLAIFGLPGGSEIWVIALLVLLLFGGAKIPQLMRGLGQGVGELKKGLDEGKKAFADAADESKKDNENKEDK